MLDRVLLSIEAYNGLSLYAASCSWPTIVSTDRLLFPFCMTTVPYSDGLNPIPMIMTISPDQLVTPSYFTAGSYSTVKIGKVAFTEEEFRLPL
jgi:hypothetical protein